MNPFVKSRLTRNTFISVICTLFVNEYLLYYIVQYKCDWPNMISSSTDAIRTMIIADTHLLGKRKGHWFDKLRREWQMHRAFQTAIALHKPELIFVLGDLFDEGLWSSKTELLEYHERFNSLFKVPKDIIMHVVPGNHDIGFHYEMSKQRTETFASLLNTPPVSLITIRNIHFILLNSIAMEGDKCNLCQQAQNMIQNISDTLNCWKQAGSCANVKFIHQYSRPVLLQHFPLYRPSDETCTEWDSVIGEEKRFKFKERWDCLSKDSTEFLKNRLGFREAWSGHTHYGCIYKHRGRSEIIEYTVASFSWRNRNDPSYILAEFTQNETFIYKCPIPTENLVYLLYILGITGIIFYWTKVVFVELNLYRKFRRLYNKDV